MRKLRRLIGISLLILSTAAVCWAGETPGTGLPSPPPPTAEGTPDLVTSQTPPTSEATPNSAALVNLLASWLVESLL